MTDKNEVIEVDLKRIFLTVWSRAWIITIVGVLCAAMFLGYAYFFVTPQYSASIKLYVNNTYGTNTPGISSSQLSAAQSLARTYMVILKSRTVLNEVAQITGLPYTYEQLRSMVLSTTVSETEVFETTVTCPDYKEAAQIANAIAQVLPDQIAAVVDGSSVRVVDYAVESDARVSPNYRNYAIIGFSVGFFATAALIIILDLLDNSINSEEYLAEVYSDLPLLAVIPDAENPKTNGYYKGHYKGYYKGYYESSGKHQTLKQTGGDK